MRLLCYLLLVTFLRQCSKNRVYLSLRYIYSIVEHNEHSRYCDLFYSCNHSYVCVTCFQYLFCTMDSSQGKTRNYGIDVVYMSVVFYL